MRTHPPRISQQDRSSQPQQSTIVQNGQTQSPPDYGIAFADQPSVTHGDRSSAVVQGVFIVRNAAGKQIDIDAIDTLGELTTTWGALSTEERQNQEVKENFRRRQNEIVEAFHSGGMGTVRKVASSAENAIASVTGGISRMMTAPRQTISSTKEEHTALNAQNGTNQEEQWTSQKDRAIQSSATSAGTYGLDHVVEAAVGESIPGIGVGVEGVKQIYTAKQIESRRANLQDDRDGSESLSDVVTGPKKVQQAQTFLIHWVKYNGVGSVSTKGGAAGAGALVGLLTMPVLGPFAVVAGVAAATATGAALNKGKDAAILKEAKQNGERAVDWLLELAYQHPDLVHTSTVPWAIKANYNSTGLTARSTPHASSSAATSEQNAGYQSYQSSSGPAPIPRGVMAALEALYVITSWQTETFASMTKAIAKKRIINTLGL